MSRIRQCLLYIVLAAGLSAAAWPASAGYVIFFSTFGDWSVTCWTDEGDGAPVGPRQCSLKAPPPKMEDTIPPERGPSVVTVIEQHSDAFLVQVQVPFDLTPGSPVYLRVDAQNPVMATPNRYGEAAVTGETANHLVAAMRAGQAMVLRSFALAGNTPHDETISLKDFGQALSVYRQELRTNHILAAGGQ